MALVGTPTDLGNPILTVASVLQGEAGNEGYIGMLGTTVIT